MSYSSTYTKPDTNEVSKSVMPVLSTLSSFEMSSDDTSSSSLEMSSEDTSVVSSSELSLSCALLQPDKTFVTIKAVNKNLQKSFFAFFPLNISKSF